MKKRIAAFLLCLVMAFSLIPTTVWANPGETRQVKMQILHVSEKYNLGYNYTSDESMMYTYTCQYSNCGSGSYNHSMKISDIRAAAQQMEQKFGVKFDGWTKTASATPQIYSFYLSGNTATQTTYTIYLVIKEAYTPTIPQPDFDTIFNSETVRVTDLNTTDGHGTKTYPLMAGRYASVKNSDTQYTITVWSAGYIKDYQDAFPGVTHNTVDGSNKTIVLNYSDGVWTPSPAFVTFTVQCETQPPQPTEPDAPGEDDLKGIDAVVVDCVKNEHDTTKPVTTGTAGKDYTIGKVENSTCTITILNSSAYYPTSPKHEQDTSKQDKPTVEFVYEDDAWKLAENGAAHLYVQCKEELPIPTDEDIDNALKGRRFLIQDVVSTNAHSTKVFFITDVAEADRIDSSSLRPVTVEELQAKYPDNNYTSNPYKTKNGEILYYLTVADAADLDPYIDLYNNHEDIGVEHKYRYHSYTSLIKTDTGWELYDAYISRVAVLCDPVPSAPSGDDLEALLKGLVNVDCSLLKDHGVKTYDVEMATLKSALKVEKAADGSFFCNVELDPAKLDTYVEKYSGEFDAPAHEADVEDENTDLTVKLIWNASAKKWAVAKDDTFTIITKCQLPPASPDLSSLDNAVIVACVGEGKHGFNGYKLKEGTYTLKWEYDVDGVTVPAFSHVFWDANRGTWRYDLYLCLEEYDGFDGFGPYIDDFNTLVGAKHDETPTSVNDLIVLVWQEDFWTDDETPELIPAHWVVDEAAYVEVTCAPAAPNADMLKDLVSVDVSCKDEPTKHDTRGYDLTDGYFSTEVFQEDGVFYCRVTLNKTQANYYVDPKFSKDKGIDTTHKLKEITKDTVLLVWRESKPLISMLDGENGNNHNGRWVLADQETGKLAVTAACHNGGGGGGTGGGGGNGGSTNTTKPVKSGKTFDAGIALYAGLGILSMTGSAVVIRKKKEF